MKNAAIVVYVLLFCVFSHARAQVEEHDSDGIAAIVNELVGEMVSIPAGSFRMGNLMAQGWVDEKPVRTVTVPAFKLGRHEVTVGQFRAFAVATGYLTDAERNAVGAEGCVVGSGRHGEVIWGPDSSWRNPGYAVADDQPVVCVSWRDAQAFVDWLNDKTGGNFRLPSEAEWEYAARAGTRTKYSWGDDIGDNRANCDGCGSQWDDDRTAPVGSFPANPWGLHDMHGNVWEWVQDCWHDGYEGAPTDGSAWKSGDCGGRVVRGGSWLSNPWGLRSATRSWDDRSGRGDSLGFRLAQDE